jgi:hypothetical protein
VLDEVVVAMRAADDARFRALQALFRHGQWTGERAPEAVIEVSEVAKELGPLRERLALRFGDEHDVVTTVDSLQKALREVAHQLSMPSDHVDVMKAWTDTNQAGEDYEARRADFVRVAVRIVGVRLR